MTYSRRIERDYNIFLALLKFSIKNDTTPEFRDFSLVNSYIEILMEIEGELNKQFNKDFSYAQYSYETLLDAIFKEKTQKYLPFIDNDQKKQLVLRFQLIIEITNMAIEREPEEIEGMAPWIEDIYNELKKIKERFLPVIAIMNKKKRRDL